MVRRTCGNSERIESTQKYRKEWAPQPLPPIRPRALTCPLPPQKSNRSWNLFTKSLPQQTFDQSQSLFARLPAELRQLIWIAVFSGHLLHIARAHKRLVAVECTENSDPGLETRRHGCWGRTYERKHVMRSTPGYYVVPESGHPSKAANLLSLLMTCRTIYTETISLLYETKFFDINHVDTLIFLERCILPKRLNEIRIVNFTWDFKRDPARSQVPYDFATWRKACDGLASFAGLQELTLYLTIYYMELGSISRSRIR